MLGLAFLPGSRSIGLPVGRFSDVNAYPTGYLFDLVSVSAVSLRGQWTEALRRITPLLLPLFAAPCLSDDFGERRPAALAAGDRRLWAGYLSCPRADDPSSSSTATAVPHHSDTTARSPSVPPTANACAAWPAANATERREQFAAEAEGREYEPLTQRGRGCMQCAKPICGSSNSVLLDPN